jgi:hypothetical protein
LAKFLTFCFAVAGVSKEAKEPVTVGSGFKTDFSEWVFCLVAMVHDPAVYLARYVVQAHLRVLVVRIAG